MKISTLRKKAKTGTLEVEDILAAARDRIPGLQAELLRLSSELDWSPTSMLVDGTHVVPLAKWGEIAGAYAEHGISALAAMNTAPENGHYIAALLQELTTDEANTALFDLFTKAMENPADHVELAYHLAGTLNFKFSFQRLPRPSAEQMVRPDPF